MLIIMAYSQFINLSESKTREMMGCLHEFSLKMRGLRHAFGESCFPILGFRKNVMNKNEDLLKVQGLTTPTTFNRGNLLRINSSKPSFFYMYHSINII